MFTKHLALYPSQGIFLLSGTLFLIGRYLIALPPSVGRGEGIIHRLGSGAEGNRIG